MGARWRRLLLGATLAAVSLAIAAGGVVVGAASAAPQAPSIAALQRQVGADAVVDTGAETHPKLSATVGAVVRVGNGRFAIKTADGRHAVVVRPQTAIWIGKQRGSLEQIKRGDAVIVLGRVGPRGNFVARAVRVVRPAST